MEIAEMVLNKDFNSRPHEEVDWKQPSYEQSYFNFNSRPHEEVDSDST